MHALTFLALAACAPQSIGAGAGIDVPGYDRVYDCFPVDGTERHLELCWYGSALELGESLGDEPGGMWTCGPTQRHAGPCTYQCPSGRGCNSFDGCWCPS